MLKSRTVTAVRGCNDFSGSQFPFIHNYGHTFRTYSKSPRLFHAAWNDGTALSIAMSLILSVCVHLLCSLSRPAITSFWSLLCTIASKNPF